MKVITVTGIILQFDAIEGLDVECQANSMIEKINAGLAMIQNTVGNAQLLAHREDINVEETEI